MVSKTSRTPQPPGIDPYWVWAKLTLGGLEGPAAPSQHRSAKRKPDMAADEEPEVGVLVESDKAFIARFRARFGHRTILEAPSDRGLCVFSLTCSPAEIDLLTSVPDLGVCRIEVSNARFAPASGATAGSRLVQAPTADRNPGIQSPDPSQLRQRAGGVTKNVLVVIDDGFGFLNANLANADGSSRIHSVWDQGQSGTAVPWACPPDIGYGGVLTREGIEALRRQVRSPADERRIYQAIGYSAASRDATHGTHVLGCALAAMPPGLRCDVILVQLPRAVSLDTSGAGTPKHVLDGLHYALARVAPQANVVVNISFGALAGPHDGSTLLEQAIDGLTRREQGRRNFAVVLPAGNALGGQCHANLDLKPGATAVLPWQVMREDPTESFCEIWAREADFPSLEVTLRSPTGEAVPQLDAAALSMTSAARLEAGRPSAAVLRAQHAYAGQSKGLVLCALAPTAPLRGHWRAAQAGTWTIELTNRANTTLSIDAWIERDNAAIFGPYQSRQSHFRMRGLPVRPQDPDPPTEVVSRRGTGNTIAHGEEVIVAGGAMGSPELGFTLPGYASMRPQGFSRAWPDVLAVTDLNRARPGIPGWGTYSGTRVWMNGTSVAAPHVAGIALALFAQERLSIPQLRAKLKSRAMGTVQTETEFERERAGQAAVV